MAQERKWDRVPPRLFTSNGALNGVIQIADATGFFAKQRVILQSDTQPLLNVEARVITPTSIQVGAIGSEFNTFLDVTAFLVADNATIEAPEQIKPTIKPDEIWQAVYQKDPALALRNLLVNKFGIPIDTVVGVDGKTRIAVDAQVTVADVSVDLDAFTKVPPDNAIAVGTEDGTKAGIKHAIKVNSDGTIRTVQLFKKPFDSITGDNPDPDAVTEIYRSRLGGDLGPVQETATITYRDATKKRILKVVVT